MLQDYYNTGDSTSDGPTPPYWDAQSFIASSSYSATSVKLKIYRVGSPGTITVSIRATDVDGKPTGSDLCSGTINGNDLTTDSAGEWKEFTFASSANLVSGTKYAIIFRALSASSGNIARFRFVNPGAYSNGCFVSSDDNGSTWTNLTGYDFVFETYGDASSSSSSSSSSLSSSSSSFSSSSSSDSSSFSSSSESISSSSSDSSFSSSSSSESFSSSSSSDSFSSSSSSSSSFSSSSSSFSSSSSSFTPASWTYGVKNTASWNETTKNTSAWTFNTKNNSIWN